MAEHVMENGGVPLERKVMVAVDDGEHSHYALMWVLNNLEESITKSPLVIFTAQPPPSNNHSFTAAALSSARMYCSVSANPEYTYTIQEQNKKIAFALLEKAKEICAGRGVDAETLTEMGDPQTAICDAVQRLNISLLVLGERGIGKIKRAIQGSVSSYCLHNAKCPVLVVKKP
ncbi:PREDICTED: universal stress protein A-like protein [Populus euphratica]|uniref:Universal stress protein A-like protein n=1 Tax=Populus euphratica TaxID=75702 RepID=A0AAJ6X712_POPEU|nr:PREDICTED: universal stress protein A-like protein [Populus euphratica]